MVYGVVSEGECCTRAFYGVPDMAVSCNIYKRLAARSREISRDGEFPALE